MTKIKHVQFHKLLEAVVRDVKSFQVEKIEPYKAWNGGILCQMSEIGLKVTVENAQRTFYVGRADYKGTSQEDRAAWPGIYKVCRGTPGLTFISRLLMAGKGVVQVEAACFAREEWWLARIKKGSPLLERGDLAAHMEHTQESWVELAKLEDQLVEG